MRFLFLFLAMMLTGCVTMFKTVYTEPVMSTVDTYVADVGETYNATVVVVGADWCPPCRQSKAMLKEMLKKNPGELKVVILDSDTLDTETQVRLLGVDVEYIPYFIVYDDGVEVFRGNSDPDELTNRLNKAMQ